MALVLKSYTMDDFKPGDVIVKLTFFDWEHDGTSTERWVVEEKKPKSLVVSNPKFQKHDRVLLSKIGEVNYANVYCKMEDAADFYTAYWKYKKDKFEKEIARIEKELEMTKGKLVHGYVPKLR